MRIAFEAPIGNTKFALEQSDFIFAIAPMLKIPAYANAVLAARNAGKELYIDNGAYEEQLMATSEYLELCFKWQPDVVVVPDIMGSGGDTVRVAGEFFKALSLIPHSFRTMVVLQGEDDESKIACGCHLKQLYGFDIVGLGLGAFRKAWRQRIRFAHTALDKTWFSPIHILGIANLADLCFWSCLAETCDTSLPFHLAQEGKVRPFSQKETKRLHWGDTLEHYRLYLAEGNIRQVRAALDGAL